MEGIPINLAVCAKSPSGSVWNTTTPANSPCSLREVMSEELVEQLQKEEADPSHFLMSESAVPFLQNNGPEDTSNDLMLALMLQHEFDTEHDEVLRRVEDKFNSTSTVKLSYEKYRAVHPVAAKHDDAENNFSEEEEGKLEKEESKPKFKKRGGFIGSGKNITTKHDSTICSRRNAERFLENLPPEYDVGDDEMLDLRLSNKVYNKLKTHMQTESKRSQKIHEKKEHSTMEHAVDSVTRLLMYKLVNSGLLESIDGIVSSGKESVVFHATGAESETEKVVPKECAIKVFKTTLTDFRNRSVYVKGDTRFFKDEFKRQNPRKIMKLWAEKEEINLRSLQRHGVCSPQVVARKKHVLVMSFIGTDGQPAPKLLNAQLSTADAQIAYKQCIDGMKKLYHSCNLVHADLSAYNLLWHKENLYFIDVSQAVDKMHPHAHEFLLRDCRNMSRYFATIGVPNVPTPFELFNHITGLNLEGDGKEFLMQIEEFEKDENKMRLGTSTKDDMFNFFFELSCQQRIAAGSAEKPNESHSQLADVEHSDEEDIDDNSIASESSDSEDADESSNVENDVK